MVKGFYNIYVNNNLLQLVSASDFVFISLKDETQKHLNYDESENHLTTAIKLLESNQCKRIVLTSQNLENLWNDFKIVFTPVEAAGGIVQNDKNEILAIYRRKSWDLPKGKIEPLEKKKAAAIREVKEECGLKDVSIIQKLGNTYHTFGSKEKRKLKISTWYAMHSSDKKLIPQLEEDIEKAEWMTVEKFIEKAIPVYPNILDVVEAYQLKKNK